MIKFKLLAQNPELNDYYQLDSQYLTNILCVPLQLPALESPFIFSCFATSVDGKLCYPDLASGFAIARNNHYAMPEERAADWWNLLLGRTISDAVLIGSNSLNNENFSFQAEINIPELANLRKQLGKPEYLLHLIISRNPDKINFQKELICQENQIPVLIFSQTKPKVSPDNFNISTLNEVSSLAHKQIIFDKDLNIQKLINLLYKLGYKTILNESPYFHHELQRQKLLNEAWLNTSGVYIGGSTTSLGQQNLSFSANDHPHYTILTLHTLGYNFIYTRYKITYS